MWGGRCRALLATASTQSDLKSVFADMAICMPQELNQGSCIAFAQPPPPVSVIPPSLSNLHGSISTLAGCSWTGCSCKLPHLPCYRDSSSTPASCSHKLPTPPPPQGHFPEAKQDPVIQIASMVTVQGESGPRVRNVMTLGSCASIVGAEVGRFSPPLPGGLPM